MDWIPRTLRQKQKKIDVAMSSIEVEKGRAATDEEIALALGITIDELNNWQGQTKASSLISLDEYTEAGSEIKMDSVGNAHFDQPEDVVEKAELKEMIVGALELLTEKEKSVIVLYYYEEMTLKEISMVLEVSESRISQLHTKALNKMRQKLGDYMDILI
jgi:RNA polymerase sigma factor for flagellar operon FliA